MTIPHSPPSEDPPHVAEAGEEPAAASPLAIVLAAARRRAADRLARRTGPRSVADTSTGRLTRLGWGSERPQLLRCFQCGRCERHTADRLRQLARGRWPECCGAVLTLAPEIDPDSIPFADPAPERRIGDRRSPRAGTRMEVRRGQLGMGPNLAMALLDLSFTGARVRLRESLSPDELVEAAFWPPGGAKVIRGPGRVIWCREDGRGTAQVGIRLRRRLLTQDLSALTE